MMRLLKPVNITDPARVIRLCTQWIKEGLGLRVVEYRIGNTFTGSIDILATDSSKIYLVTINTDRLSDALLSALRGYGWYIENLDFLTRIYQPSEIDFSFPPVLMILSASFPPEITSILRHGLKADVRLFRYLILGSEDDPDLYVEELGGTHIAVDSAPFDPAALKQELGIEEAGLTDEEIKGFLIAMRA